VQKLSGLDTGFYYLDSPGMHLHIGVVLIFDGTSIPIEERLAATKAQILDRIHAMDHFSQKIAEIPFGLGEPYWTNDANFNIDNHVKAGVLDSIDRDRLVELAGEFISIPLDKARPLWEIMVLPHLDKSRFALVAKLHHTMIDGIMGIEVLANLFDFEANPREFWGPKAVAVEAEEVGMANLVGIFANSLIDKFQSVPEDARKTISALSQWLSFTSDSDNSRLLKPLFAAPKTPINGALTSERVAHSITFPLTRLKLLAKAAHVTVNDLLMSIVSFALDDYLKGKDWQGGVDLVSMMPMANHRRDDQGGSNQISALFVSLGNSITDPKDRVIEIARATSAAKRFHRKADLAELVRLTHYVPPLFTWALSRVAHQLKAFDYIGPAFNILISSVKGPDQPLFFAGTKLEEVIPFGPLADSTGLSVTAVSYSGQMVLGLVGDSKLAGDVVKFGDAISDAVELLESIFSAA
ncbi:unnamed protein product, partial [Acidithrix sp. C25]